MFTAKLFVLTLGVKLGCIHRLASWLARIGLIVLCLGLQACAHSDSAFPKPQQNFDQHIIDVKAHLLAHQMPHRSEADAELNLPFDRKASADAPYRGKFLLIHGLNDSPFIWRDIAKALTERGFDVRAILLPGHGSTPEAQLSMSYKRWLNATREQVRLYQEPNTPFYLGGFSLGGVIATLLASEAQAKAGKKGYDETDANTTTIDGLLLFSPAFQSNMDHLLRWAGIYKRYKPWMFGGMIREDNPAKYNSIPINTGSQYYKTARLLKKQWPQKPLSIPTLAVASANDSVLDVNYIVESFDTGFIGEKKLIIYNNEVNEQPTQEHIELRPSAYPKLRVLNQSHQSVLLAPHNSLYGADGRVRVCNGNEWAVFSRCLFYTGTHWLGAQHTPSPDGVPVARTTYNPDFIGVMDAFDALFLR